MSDTILEEEIKQKAEKVIKLFERKLDMTLPKEYYPRIRVLNSSHRSSYYDPDFNTIVVSIYDPIGEALGEEIGHFFRHVLHKKSPNEKKLERPITTEFFGYLGRKVLYESLTEEEREKMFPDGLSYSSEDMRKTILFNARSARSRERGLSNKIEHLAGEMVKRGTKEEEILAYKGRARELGEKAIREKYAKRKNDLVHHRGYTYASQLDLGKVKNLKYLFEMPNQEVRRNFFRSDQRYAVLEHHSEVHHEKGLEHTVTSLIAIVSLASSLIVFSSNITGNVIAELSLGASNIIGATLFLLGVSASFLYFRRRRKLLFNNFP